MLYRCVVTSDPIVPKLRQLITCTNSCVCLLYPFPPPPLLCTPLPPFLISSFFPLSSSAIAYLLPSSLLPPPLLPLESGSARFNAEQMARTVQARIVANKTSQGVGGTMGPNIYAREPNKALSFYIGNLTWVREDLYLCGFLLKGNAVICKHLVS